MSDWADLGLPCPSRDGYGYTRDLGLIRTPFPTAAPEQRQAQDHLTLTFTVSWLLTGAQLALAERYLLAHGYQGIVLDLVSGASPDGIPTPHAVRLTADYEVTAVRPDVFRLAIQAETPVAITGTCLPATCDVIDPDDQRCDPTPQPITLNDGLAVQGGIVAGEREAAFQIVASGLYPIEVDDQMTTSGWLTAGWLIALVQEAFSADVAITGGEKVQIYADVFHTQAPEAFTADVAIISGVKIQIYADVFHTQAQEPFSADVAITGGVKVGVGVTTANQEAFTSQAWLVTGELS